LINMDPEVAAAIGLLLETAKAMGYSPVLIGALASGLAPDRPSDAPSPRKTMDADFAINVPRWEDYTALIAALVKADHPRDPHLEHRVYIRGIKIDLVPFGPGVAPDGASIQWPQTQLRMDITGFEEASKQSREVQLIEGVRVRCVTVAGFVLLKVPAFLDRYARQNQKYKNDAEDLLFWFKHYASGSDDSPRFEVAGNNEASIDYYSAGAAVLGRDVARLASAQARSRIGDFLALAKAEDSPFFTAVSRPSFDEADEARALAETRALLCAFAWGFSRSL
jgi:predicted nucleotidyltransferase